MILTFDKSAKFQPNGKKSANLNHDIGNATINQQPAKADAVSCSAINGTTDVLAGGMSVHDEQAVSPVCSTLNRQCSKMIIPLTINEH